MTKIIHILILFIWNLFKSVHEHLLEHPFYTETSHYLNHASSRLVMLYRVTRQQWDYFSFVFHMWLTHWGRVTHISISKLTIIGSDNGLSPGRCQAIISTSAVIFLIGYLGTNFSEILIGIHTFSFKKIHLKMSSGKWRPFCLGLNVVNCSETFGYHHSH